VVRHPPPESPNSRQGLHGRLALPLFASSPVHRPPTRNVLVPTNVARGSATVISEISSWTILSMKGRWQDTNRSVLKAEIEDVWEEFFHSFGGCKSVSAPKTYKQQKCKTDGCNRQLRLKPSNPTCERFIIQVHSDVPLFFQLDPPPNCPDAPCTSFQDTPCTGGIVAPICGNGISPSELQ
jgi:hypothetical protein